LDLIISQDLTRDRSNNRYAKAGQRHDEDGRRNKHNNYGDGRDNLESKQKQLDNEHRKYPQDIRRPIKSNLKQYRKSSILSSTNAS